MEYTDEPRAFDSRDVITETAHAVFWEKDGRWHVARPDKSRGESFYWTDETYQTREAAVAGLGA